MPKTFRETGFARGQPDGGDARSQCGWVAAKSGARGRVTWTGRLRTGERFDGSTMVPPLDAKPMPWIMIAAEQVKSPLRCLVMKNLSLPLIGCLLLTSCAFSDPMLDQAIARYRGTGIQQAGNVLPPHEIEDVDD